MWRRKVVFPWSPNGLGAHLRSNIVAHKDMKLVWENVAEYYREEWYQKKNREKNINVYVKALTMNAILAPSQWARG